MYENAGVAVEYPLWCSLSTSGINADLVSSSHTLLPTLCLSNWPDRTALQFVTKAKDQTVQTLSPPELLGYWFVRAGLELVFLGCCLLQLSRGGVVLSPFWQGWNCKLFLHTLPSACFTQAQSAPNRIAAALKGQVVFLCTRRIAQPSVLRSWVMPAWTPGIPLPSHFCCPDKWIPAISTFPNSDLCLFSSMESPCSAQTPTLCNTVKKLSPVEWGIMGYIS